LNRNKQQASACATNYALPCGPKQQKHVKGTLTYAVALRRIRRAYIFRECNNFDQKTRKSHAYVIVHVWFAKILISTSSLSICLSPMTTHFTFAKKSLFSLIFARYIFIRSFLFISLRSAPNRGTNRNASEGRGTAEKNFAESTDWTGMTESQGKRAIERTAENAEMRKGTIKSEGYERDGRLRRGRPPRKKLRKRFVSRRDGIATWLRIAGASELPRPPGAPGLRKFRWSSVDSRAFPEDSTKIRVASHHQSTADLTGGTDEVTRITEIRRLHSEWNSDGSGSPRKFAAVRRYGMRKLSKLV